MFSVDVVFDVRHATDGDVNFPGLMILDTACQRTCCGTTWATSHASLLRAQDLLVYRAPCTNAFQFGSGDPVRAKHRLYMPAGIGEADLVIGAGVLEANIPLLASNQLLDELGFVLDMPRSSATFTKLGVTVPVLRKNGHLTISVVELSKHVPSDSTRWKQLQDAVDWLNPPPELVFLAQAVTDTSSSASLALHAGDSSDMASRMAPPGALPPAPQAQCLHPDGPCGEPRPPDARDLPGRAAGARRELRASRGNLQPPRLCPVRQRVRQVRSLQTVPEEMEVERPRRSVGRTPGQQVRGIAAQFATALAILIQYCASPSSAFAGGGTIDPAAFQAPRHDTQGITGDTGEDFDNSRTQAPHNPFYAEWLGDVGLDTVETAAQPSSGDGIRLGRRRRLSGNWARSAGVLDRERRSTTASCQPPADHRLPSTSWSCSPARPALLQRHPVMDSVPQSPLTRSLDGTSRNRRPRTMSLRWSSGCGPMSSTWPTRPTPAPCTPSLTRTSTTASACPCFIAYGKMIRR